MRVRVCVCACVCVCARVLGGEEGGGHGLQFSLKIRGGQAPPRNQPLDPPMTLQVHGLISCMSQYETLLYQV